MEFEWSLWSALLASRLFSALVVLIAVSTVTAKESKINNEMW